MSRPLVIFDKDGTLIENVPYNGDPERVRLAPGAGEAVRRLYDAGFAIMVASNQSGVARGYLTEADLDRVGERLNQLLAAEGGTLAGFLYCPHHPEGSVWPYAVECDCRKPAPGLLLRAARLANADPSACWMVGDILHDIEAGNRAGMRTVLLDNGHETEWCRSPYRWPSYVARTLPEAARLILHATRLAPEPALQAGQGP